MVITIARKPLSEPTVAQNLLEHGCGALNIDASRIPQAPCVQRSAGQGRGHSDTPGHGIFGAGMGGVVQPPHPLGKYPSNLILQYEALGAVPAELQGNFLCLK